MAKILLLEDDPNVAETFIDIATGFGHEVDHAWNGQEGLQKAVKHEYDLIISDNRMPKVMGPDFTRMATEAGVTTKIVACTSDASDNDVRENFLMYGAKQVYEKAEFVKILKTLEAA